MDNDTLTQLDSINAKMRDIVYSIKAPEHMFFDLDSTLLNTYGKQEGEGFNFHYQAHGYHPLQLFSFVLIQMHKFPYHLPEKYYFRSHIV